MHWARIKPFNYTSFSFVCYICWFNRSKFWMHSSINLKFEGPVSLIFKVLLIKLNCEPKLFAEFKLTYFAFKNTHPENSFVETMKIDFVETTKSGFSGQQLLVSLNKQNLAIFSYVNKFWFLKITKIILLIN